MTNDWLAQLKPGDTVLVQGRGNALSSAPLSTTGKVFKVTKTMIVLRKGNEDAPGTRFRRDTGREVTTDSGHWAQLLEPTPEAIATHDKTWSKFKIVRRLEGTDWKQLPLELLETINRVLDAEKQRVAQAHEDHWNKEFHVQG